ncbi:MAG: DUF488 domain-containing protein [Proteobacteria bacterium]|nr:DUF488 domain-containing protein [Pseudomonadota bacterium]
MSSEALTIWTIGHSTRTTAEFLGMLEANAIEAIADVRRYPGSRKNPQFNPDTLRASLADTDIDYVAFPELGGRRHPRPDSRNTVWRNEAFRGYADYMQTPEFSAGMDRLLELAQHKRTAIMCAEAVWWRCHRSLIADWLKVRGIDVQHILAAGKTQPHPYTSAARVENGMLTYAPPSGEST